MLKMSAATFVVPQ